MGRGRGRRIRIRGLILTTSSSPAIEALLDARDLTRSPGGHE